MERLKVDDIRDRFLHFFESKGHLILPSFPLIPKNDKSLLLINSGMAPLKPYFTGQETPPSKRVTTCQKCIRTPDIERVGKTARHGTFFEMLGNFSFGDYFKKEAIPWAWEFVTQVLGLPVDRLWVSIYEQDDEAFDIWHNDVGLPEERIVRMGKEDNFWEIGVGPCGPCSELYFDRGEDKGCGKPDCGVGCECDRFVEFWNLVFTQFYRNEDGTYDKLEHPNIDTGMGLERMAVIMQGVDSIFEIDTIGAILDYVAEIAGVSYGSDDKNDMSLRVITDHARSAAFMAGDGILPSNEGRGYVMRRLIRRAIRHGRLLGIRDPFLYRVTDQVIEHFKGAYPELAQRRDFILRVINMEEERFDQTLDQGMLRLEEIIERMRAQGINTLNGEDAFKLYDTYGFPLDLTQEILSERGMKIDTDGFEKQMQAQKERARAARKQTNYMGSDEDIYAELPDDVISVFTGYDRLEDDGVVSAIVVDGELRNVAVEGDEVEIILDRTPFYAQSGGQVGDTGWLYGNGARAEVYDCKKATGRRIIHLGRMVEGSLAVGDKVHATVDEERRMATARNHTATHLLHKALRDTLGAHVEQAGSLVTPDRLRFDFSHFAPMTQQELDRVEYEVNKHILDDLEVTIEEMAIEEARKTGAMALFDEKYGDKVRVVSIDAYSKELCGGTHLKRTGQAGLFKIISESGVAAGVRRVEAVTGFGVLEHFKQQQQLLDAVAVILKTAPKDIPSRVEALLKEIKDFKQQVQDAKNKKAVSIDDIMSSADAIGDTRIIVYRVDNVDMQSMRNMLDNIKDRLKDGVAVLAGVCDGKVNIVAGATKSAVQQGIHAGNLAKRIAASLGGSGGGRPDMGQAGAKNAEALDKALAGARDIISEQMKAKVES
ncbi:alanine--tRNA ligase [Mahella australiensis]|uniref:Alanine--tRNA ligase n=1 Tax=Mahella australiensis (strain DSM 15567 / CIP 107919 / 50-1 BON) TaxID=697281 RepID=F3ZX86_MAHA5|nr:alanine--tRNA ligase [Mahella australiensis]AEE96543.1 alanyl-tRNA synthetase [Mahella australiensis 50-1 BON]